MGRRECLGKSGQHRYNTGFNPIGNSHKNLPRYDPFDPDNCPPRPLPPQSSSVLRTEAAPRRPCSPVHTHQWLPPDLQAFQSLFFEHQGAIDVLLLRIRSFHLLPPVNQYSDNENRKQMG